METVKYHTSSDLSTVFFRGSISFWMKRRARLIAATADLSALSRQSPARMESLIRPQTLALAARLSLAPGFQPARVLNALAEGLRCLATAGVSLQLAGLPVPVHRGKAWALVLLQCCLLRRSLCPPT